ncbi:MAG TPA: hypothetical protein VGE01_01000 [Fimbriimonas sp.]
MTAGTLLLATAFAGEKDRDAIRYDSAMRALYGSSQVRAQRFADQRIVTLKIHRVAQHDNLDQGDLLAPDRADFFARVWVNGQQYKTRNFSWDDGNPKWIIRAPISGNTAVVRLQLMDDDGGLEERDDHVDINKYPQEKDLVFTYNAATGKITGDLMGTRGAWITSAGGGDDDKGRIVLSIQ